LRNLLRITDAAVLAIHALAALGSHRHPRAPVSSARLASAMKVSEAHLSKVLQRLARAGMVKSVRGPRGGFTLDHDPTALTLLQVIEAIDGPLGDDSCLLGRSVCNSPADCAMRSLAAEVRELVTRRLGKLTLDDFDLTDLIPDP